MSCVSRAGQFLSSSFQNEGRYLDAVIERGLASTRNTLEPWESQGAHAADRIRSFIDADREPRRYQTYVPSGSGTSSTSLQVAMASRGNKLFMLFRTWSREQFTLLGLRQPTPKRPGDASARASQGRRHARKRLSRRSLYQAGSRAHARGGFHVLAGPKARGRSGRQQSVGSLRRPDIETRMNGSMIECLRDAEISKKRPSRGNHGKERTTPANKRGSDDGASLWVAISSRNLRVAVSSPMMLRWAEIEAQSQRRPHSVVNDVVSAEISSIAPSSADEELNLSSCWRRHQPRNSIALGSRRRRDERSHGKSCGTQLPGSLKNSTISPVPAYKSRLFHPIRLNDC